MPNTSGLLLLLLVPYLTCYYSSCPLFYRVLEWEYHEPPIWSVFKDLCRTYGWLFITSRKVFTLIAKQLFLWKFLTVERIIYILAYYNQKCIIHVIVCQLWNKYQSNHKLELTNINARVLHFYISFLRLLFHYYELTNLCVHRSLM